MEGKMPLGPFEIVRAWEPAIPNAVGDDRFNSLHLARIPHDIDPKRRWRVFLTGDTGEEVEICPPPSGEWGGNQLVLHRPDGSEAPITHVAQLRVTGSSFGEFRYGLHPAGYGTWVFYEKGGGGAVVVPYIVWGNELYIGLVEQERPFQNRRRKVPNVPRGFLKAELDHLQTAKQEGAEEMMITVGSFETEETKGDFRVRLHAIPAHPGNPNSTFFIHDAERNEGIHFFGVEYLNAGVTADFFTSDKPWNIRFRIAQNLSIRYAPENERLLEQIRGLTFVHWIVAAQVGDMMTNSSVARLQAYLTLRKAGLVR